jgi:phosphatidylglycerol:prolipoprotein diacylglycerol transferase
MLPPPRTVHSPVLAWLNTLDPVALHLGPFALRWYGLSYAAGFLVAFFIIRALARRGVTPIPAERAADAVILGALGAVIGGRLGYALFYDPRLFWSFSESLPWWDLLAIHRGGMASHGGMAGAMIAAWMISRGWRAQDGSRIGRAPFLHVADIVALCAPPGLLLGRVANFINGELLGRIVAQPGEPAPAWAVRFPQEVLSEHAPALTPPQAAALNDLVDSVALPGESFAAGFTRLLGLMRQGSNDLGARLEPLLAARHPSQLYQALAEGVFVGAVVWLVARRPRVPGVIGCWFLITYGVLRIITEFWRLPDAHLAVERPLGLSRGQWFSAAMVCIGVVVLARLSKSMAPRMGGWGAPRSPRGLAPRAPSADGRP